MHSITLPAYAKINLSLEIVGKRKDGYHLLRTVMQNISLCDYITIEKAPRGIIVESNEGSLPKGEDNIAYKAAELFCKECNIDTGVKIFIEKNIPLAAGLAGGSSDAAAVLQGLNIIFRTGLTVHKLAYLGARIGADIPFCVVGGTVLAEGIGERIKLLPPVPEVPVVLVKPDFGVSTAEVYKNFKFSKKSENSTSPILKAARDGKYDLLFQQLKNDLESVTFKLHPEVEAIKDEFLRIGSRASLMCGSGPTVFGIFDNIEKAETAVEHFKERYKGVYLTYTI